MTKVSTVLGMVTPPVGVQTRVGIHILVTYYELCHACSAPDPGTGDESM